MFPAFLDSTIWPAGLDEPDSVYRFYRLERYSNRMILRPLDQKSVAAYESHHPGELQLVELASPKYETLVDYLLTSDTKQLRHFLGHHGHEDWLFGDTTAYYPNLYVDF